MRGAALARIAFGRPRELRFVQPHAPHPPLRGPLSRRERDHDTNLYFSTLRPSTTPSTLISTTGVVPFGTSPIVKVYVPI
jgi:hypothetical protein